jgi:hypothetical protein
MKKKIVIINGYPGSGKDTFIDICRKLTKVESVSIIDIVKHIASKAGWNNDKSPKGRKFLCDLKDILTEYNDFPIRDVALSTEEFLMWESGLLFVTMRQPEDIERFKKVYPEAITLFIRRDKAKVDYEMSETKNGADSGVEDYNYDYYVYNDRTLDDLKDCAQAFLTSIQDFAHDGKVHHILGKPDYTPKEEN